MLVEGLAGREGEGEGERLVRCLFGYLMVEKIYLVGREQEREGGEKKRREEKRREERREEERRGECVSELDVCSRSGQGRRIAEEGRGGDAGGGKREGGGKR